MLPKSYLIAFSFANEMRPFVVKVASTLAGVFGYDKVLYDKVFEGVFARSDLGNYLPARYAEASDLVVVVLSPQYEQSDWCRKEWDAIRARMEAGDAESILLARSEIREYVGLDANSGFLDLPNKTPLDVAILIGQRLAESQKVGLDKYSAEIEREYSRQYGGEYVDLRIPYTY